MTFEELDQRYYTQGRTYDREEFDALAGAIASGNKGPVTTTTDPGAHIVGRSFTFNAAGTYTNFPDNTGSAIIIPAPDANKAISDGRIYDTGTYYVASYQLINIPVQDLSPVVKYVDIDTGISGGTNKVADANAFKKINDQFNIVSTPTVLFNGGTDTPLSVSINEGASKIWVAANRSCIVPVVAGHTVRIEGRSGNTIPSTGIWLTGNDHTLGATPAFLTGDFAGSSFVGDADKVVPAGATYLYILMDVPRSLTAKITDLSNVVITITIKDSAVVSKIDKASIDTLIAGGAGKVADASAFKKVNDLFGNEISPIYLYNGATDTPYNVSVNEGASKIWAASNRCCIVPVVAGHTVRIEGRTGDTLSKNCLWLTSNSHVVGDTPAFLTGDYAGSVFNGDTDKVVPTGATYLYVIFDTPRSLTCKVTDLTVATTFKLLASAIPASITDQINANSLLKTNNKFVLTKYTDVAVGRDCNLYFDSITTEPDKGSICQITAYSNNFVNLLRYAKQLKYKPTSTAANFDALLTLRDYNFNSISSATKTYRTVPKTGGSGTKRIMMLGDSFVNIGLLSREVWNLLLADGDYTLSILGTRTPQFTDTHGYKNEGYSGWAWNNFVNLDSAPVSGVTTTNPFRTGGALNIPAYFTANGYSGIDVMVINLGVNDFNYVNSIITDAQIAAVIADAKTFMNAVLAYAPACKIILNLPTVGGGDFYQTQSIQPYRKYNCQRGALAYIANFDNGAFNTNVVLCDSGQWIDRLNGFATTTVNSADRLTSPLITETQSTDPVHPKDLGYYQQADGVYSKIRSVLAGNVG